MQKLPPFDKDAKVRHPEQFSESPSPAASSDQRGFGLYIHFPWCLQKCPYCDFLSIARDRPEIPREQYTRAVLHELDRRAKAFAGRPLTTVFFGGGTPSLWGAEGIGEVLAALPRYFSFAATGVEITVECNPSSFSFTLGRQLVSAGVNRVSIGVQSLNAERLQFLGRLHDAEGGLAAVRAALEAQVPRVSADMIFAVAGQSAEDAAAEVQRVAALGVHHLSAYSLTIEPGTAFGALHKKGRLPLLPEATVAESFGQVEAALESLGFEHYEISNYAKPGEQSLHNLGYWRGHDYLGLGVGAWGTVSQPGDGPALRYRNTPSWERYLSEEHWPSPTPETAERGSVFHSCEALTPAARRIERLMLGLRVREGVDTAALERELGVVAIEPGALSAYNRRLARGDVSHDAGRLRIPSTRWLFADSIIRDLV